MNDARLVATVALSARAVERINDILASEAPGSVLRLGVEGGGCSGFQYNYTIEPGPGAEDLLIEREGARLVVDPVSLSYLAGARIDFVDDLMGQSFRIDNPNASSSCGCGSSFSI